MRTQTFEAIHRILLMIYCFLCYSNRNIFDINIQLIFLSFSSVFAY